MDTAALLDPYTIAGKRDAGREGSCVAQNDPNALDTFTTTGCPTAAIAARRLR
jgi:hypothetical protein